MFYFSTFYFINYLFNFKHCHTQLYVIFLSYVSMTGKARGKEEEDPKCL